MDIYSKDIFEQLRNEPVPEKIETIITTSNEKFGLNIDEQIEHLKKNKNIDFEENEEDAKNYLLKHSYADVITPVKVLFSSGYCEEKKCHLYDTSTKWEDIRRIHEELQKLETTLLQASLSLELELKSVFCEWLSEYLKIKHIEFIDFLKLLQNNKTRKENKTFFELNDFDYNKLYIRDYYDYKDTTYNTRWWLLIMAMSFGDFCMIATANLNPEKPKEKLLHLFSKKTNFKNTPDIHTINTLRNSLAHNTNLLIYLDKPLKKIDNDLDTYWKRNKAIKFLLHYTYSAPKVGDNGIIFRYKHYRNNLGSYKFSKIQL